MIRNWPTIALILTALAGALAHLSEPPTAIHYLKLFVVIVAVLLALMGFAPCRERRSVISCAT